MGERDASPLFYGEKLFGERALESPVSLEPVPAQRWRRDHLHSRSRGANSKRQPHVDRVFALLNPLEVTQFPPSPIAQTRILLGGFPCRAGPRMERRRYHRMAAFFCPLRLPYGLRSSTCDLGKPCSRGLHFSRFRHSTHPSSSPPATPRKTSSAHQINAPPAPHTHSARAPQGPESPTASSGPRLRANPLPYSACKAHPMIVRGV